MVSRGGYDENWPRVKGGREAWTVRFPPFFHYPFFSLFCRGTDTPPEAKPLEREDD